MNIVLIILAELIFVSSLILFFYRLKSRLGLGPLYVLLGSNQYFQAILANAFKINLFDSLSIAAGSYIVFSSSLFAILLIYIKEGVRVTQRIIFAIVFANLSFTILSEIIQLQELAANGTTSGAIDLNFRVFFIGTVTLILDAFIMIILYEFFFTKAKWLNLFVRLQLTLLIILNFDAIVFVTGSFWGRPNFNNIILSQLFGKSVAAVFFAFVLWLYLRYLDKKDNHIDKKGNEDIFSILTYKHRFEKLRTEKVVSEEQLKNIIKEKTTEQDKALHRYSIMASVRELRIDKFSTSEQAKEFLIKVRESFEADACTIHLIKNEELEMLASLGIEENNKEYQLKLTLPYLTEIISKKQILFIEDTRKDPNFHSVTEPGSNIFSYISCAGAPLLNGDRVIGLLKLYSVESVRRFTKLELEHLQLIASQMSHNIEASQLFEQNEKHKEVLVKQIVSRKKIEEAIKESEERYRTLVENAPEALVVLDAETKKFISVSKSAVGLFKMSIEELLNAGPLELSPEYQPDGRLSTEGSIEKINEAIEGGKPSFEWTHNDKDGNLIPCEVRLVRLPAENKILIRGSIIDITDRKKAEELIKSSNEQLRQLTGHLQTIREEERSRIGQEIHDQLGQHLTVLKMDVSRLKKNIPAGKNKEQDLEEIMSELDNCLQMVRKISSDLRPSMIDDLGLIAAFEWQTEEFEKRTEIFTRFSSNVSELKLPQSHSIGLFRIYQESLTNVVRHAEANTVTTELNLIDGIVQLIISDNGKGFDTDSVGGRRSLGLLGMRERTLLMNGRYEIISEPGKGTIVKVTVPL